jgi:hypothetical protein
MCATRRRSEACCYKSVQDKFYQNWKDLIVACFELDPRDHSSYAPTWTETQSRIAIAVHRQSSQDTNVKELLGYIRFERKSGCLEIANFNARLERGNLDLGGTNKRRQHDKFAGAHGEGFKIAALVMRRNKHVVCISTSSYYWNFGFDGVKKHKGRLYCKHSKPAPSTLEKQNLEFARETAQGTCRTKLKSFLGRDVAVRISKARGNDGHKITESDFRRWVEVALDLKRPSQPEDMIQTKAGDLILNPGFAGSGSYSRNTNWLGRHTRSDVASS